MKWSFAIINGQLAELFFERKGKVIKYIGHAYVKASEYKTKKEKKWIQDETARLKFIYRDGKYRKLREART